jgi:predicted permease
VRSLIDDLRFAFRLLINGRTVTVLAIITLAIGIGANTAMFSFLNFVFFQTADAGSPRQLVWIGEGPDTNAFGRMSVPHFRQVQQSRIGLSGTAAYASVQTSIGGGTPERTLALVVSANFFDVMQVRPVIGRSFAADEDVVAGATPVVMLSEATWTTRFARNRAVIGTPIILNGTAFTIIGVAPPGFHGVDRAEPVAAFVPLAMINAVSVDYAGALTDPANRFVRVAGRVAAGQSVQGVRAAALVAAAQLNSDIARPDERVTLAVKPLIGTLEPGSRQDVTQVFLLLALVPAFVLLIACANAANMQLARGLARRREIAVRSALGASRMRLMRQLLTESVLIAMLAGVVGSLFAYWLIRLIVAVAQLPPGFAEALRLEPQVLAATLAIALVSGVAFGLLPALIATRFDLTASLKDEGASVNAGGRRFRIRNLLIVGQVCVSMVLLATAGLFLRSLNRSLRVDPGFNPRNAVATSFDLRPLRYTADMRLSLMRDVQARALALPGVTAAGFASVLPLSGNRTVLPIVREGVAVTPETPPIDFASVTPSYFGAMEVRLTRGRLLTEADTRASAPVAVIDARLAERFWPGESAIGKRIRVASDTAALREVVGVTTEMITGGLTDPPGGFVYLPDAQFATLDAPLSLVVRSRAEPTTVLGPIRTLFRDVDPDLPLQDLMTYGAMLERSADGQRATVSVLGVLGGLALLLAGLGLFGITSHGVTVRTREIGIRMALGARSAQIQQMFVREGVVLTVIGIVLGLLASLALAKVLSAFLFGLGATDGVAFLMAAGLLCVVAVVASFFPARRAASVDPLVALRFS